MTTEWEEQMENARNITRVVAADGRHVIKIFDGSCRYCGFPISKVFSSALACDNCGEKVNLCFFDLINTVVTNKLQGTSTDYQIRQMYLANN